MTNLLSALDSLEDALESMQLCRAYGPESPDFLEMVDEIHELMRSVRADMEWDIHQHCQTLLDGPTETRGASRQGELFR